MQVWHVLSTPHLITPHNDGVELVRYVHEGIDRDVRGLQLDLVLDKCPRIPRDLGQLTLIRHRLEPMDREARVFQQLRGCVQRPHGVQPSVESCLHALLGRVVVHTHPLALLPMLCGRELQATADAVLGPLGRETLIIEYCDPGYSLARRVHSGIAAFEERSGRKPSLVLLQNHGIFVTADDVDSARAIADPGGVSVVDALMQEDVLVEEDILAMLGGVFGMEVFSLRDYEIPQEIRDMVPEDVRCDGAQSIKPSVLREIVGAVKGPISMAAV